MAGASTIGRTGADYLADLDDGRQVTIDGARVEGVGSAPPFAGPAASVAGIIDLHHAAAGRETMNASAGDSGAPISRYYSLSTTPEEVALRGRCFEAVARSTGGLMGRSPDFLATLLASWRAAAAVFGRGDTARARHLTSYYDNCAARTVCHTHAISDPPADRARAAGGEPLALRRVRRTGDGIVVSGMKMLATLAPLADELLVYPFRPLAPGEEDKALVLALPIDAPGLRLVCRPPLADRGPADRPLAARFDEMDAVCVFDDVHVPAERVFVDGDVELANTLRAETGMTAYLWHQSSVRAAVKAELLLGAASLVVAVNGHRGEAATEEKLGEMGAIAEALRSLVTAAEAGVRRDRFGFFVPAAAPLGASGVLNGQLYARLVELLQLVGSSSLIMVPSPGDLDGPDAAALRDYLGADGESGHRAVAIQRLAAELSISAFAGRQVLYERFFLGPPEAARRRYHQVSDLGPAERLAEALLVEPQSPVPPMEVEECRKPLHQSPSHS
jgi:aromatic ring hydroxylase